MHGGTQTICFWAFGGYNMSTGGVKAHVAACGSLAGWFQVAIQAVDWFEHHLSMVQKAGKIDDAISKRGKRENI